MAKGALLKRMRASLGDSKSAADSEWADADAALGSERTPDLLEETGFSTLADWPVDPLDKSAADSDWADADGPLGCCC